MGYRRRPSVVEIAAVRTARLRATVESVVPAPTVNPSRALPRTPRSSATPERPTSTFGSNCRRFMFG